MRTYGLGGDSEVRIDLAGLIARIELGPRRVLPLSLIGRRFPDIVIPALEKQLGAVHAQRHEGLFAIRTGLPESMAAGLSSQERHFTPDHGSAPAADPLLTTAPQKSALDRLAARGLAHICGITPSDALHVLGRQGQWNVATARLGLDIAARQKGGNGKPIAADAEDLANRIVQRLTRDPRMRFSKPV